MRVKNVSEWLEASAKRFPNKIAFSDGKTEMTFVELREAARHIWFRTGSQGVLQKSCDDQTGEGTARYGGVPWLCIQRQLLHSHGFGRSGGTRGEDKVHAAPRRDYLCREYRRVPPC